MMKSFLSLRLVSLLVACPVLWAVTSKSYLEKEEARHELL